MNHEVEKANQNHTHKPPQRDHTIMKTTEELNTMYDKMLELELCTFEEIELVTSINGYNEQAINDIVYVRTGYNRLEQYTEMLEMNEASAF